MNRVVSFLLSNWRAVAVTTFVAYALFLGYRVSNLTRENEDLRQRIEIEEQVSAASETSSAELSSLLHVYYESRISNLQAAQKDFDEANAKEAARFEQEVKDLHDRQRRFYRQLREMGEADPEGLTCELAKNFNLPGCVK